MHFARAVPLLSWLFVAGCSGEHVFSPAPGVEGDLQPLDAAPALDLQGPRDAQAPTAFTPDTGVPRPRDAGAADVTPGEWGPPAPDAASPVQCLPHPPTFGAPDPETGRAFDRAKQACDAQFHTWLCGLMWIALDGAGCTTGFRTDGASDAYPGYDACMVRELVGQCTPCLASAEWRSFTSCTLR